MLKLFSLKFALRSRTLRCSSNDGSDAATDGPTDHQPPAAIPTAAAPRHRLSPTPTPLSSHFVPAGLARRGPLSSCSVLRPKLGAEAAAVCRNEAVRATALVAGHTALVGSVCRRPTPGDGCHLFIYDRQTDWAGPPTVEVVLGCPPRRRPSPSMRSAACLASHLLMAC